MISKIDLDALMRQGGALADQADRIAQRIETERTDHAQHRMAVSCRDFAAAVRHALSSCRPIPSRIPMRPALRDIVAGRQSSTRLIEGRR